VLGVNMAVGKAATSRSESMAGDTGRRTPTPFRYRIAASPVGAFQKYPLFFCALPYPDTATLRPIGRSFLSGLKYQQTVGMPVRDNALSIG
jgi:hypothetical protein